MHNACLLVDEGISIDDAHGLVDVGVVEHALDEWLSVLGIIPWRVLQLRVSWAVAYERRLV